MSSNVATVSITMKPLPVANSQSVTTTENTDAARSRSSRHKLRGDPLIYGIVGLPTHGTLTGTPPNVTYAPAANYLGTDSFAFVAKDGSVSSNTATISITVAGTDSAPVAQRPVANDQRKYCASRSLAAADLAVMMC